MDYKEYQALKPAEWKQACETVEAINQSTDPCVRYKTSRPIIDLKHMLATSADLFADRPAFHVKDRAGGAYRAISYKEAKEDIDALGTALVSLGLKGKRIGIIGSNCYPWASSYLAVICGVGVVVPLDKELPEEELEGLMAEAEVECVIFGAKYEKMFTEMKKRGNVPLRFLVSQAEPKGEDVLSWRRLIENGKKLIAEGNTEYLDALIERDVMSALIFTSGTTGIAKGVMLSHGNLVEDLMSAPTMMEVYPTDIFFSVLPIHHTYECTCGFLMPLYKGASIAYCEGLKYITKNLSEIHPTLFLGVPLIFENIYKKIWSQAKKNGMDKKMRMVLSLNKVTKKIGIDLVPKLLKPVLDVFGGNMRVMISGGAAIDPAVLDGLAEFGIIALQGYGLTECSPMCALNPDKGMKNSSVGHVLPGFDAKIDNPDPETGIGEICAKGPHIMLGYYRNEEATAEALRDGWFHTGDLGYMDSDRFIYITGRKKNVIITKNGKNVFPEEIEYYLGRIPYVEESLVYGKESEESGEILIFAAIKPNREECEAVLGENCSDEQIRELLWKEIDGINEKLPFFKRIKKIDIRKKDFEKTTGQKIKRFVESNKGA